MNEKQLEFPIYFSSRFVTGIISFIHHRRPEVGESHTKSMHSSCVILGLSFTKFQYYSTTHDSPRIDTITAITTTRC